MSDALVSDGSGVAAVRNISMVSTASGAPVGPALSGRPLRFVLVDALMRWRRGTVRELVEELHAQGFWVEGRASKVISDALRWEVARGRVVRLGRGVYAYVAAPPSTARRIRVLAARCRLWIVAVTRGQRPPPMPTDRRAREGAWRVSPSDPERPPWQHLGWLWCT